MRFALVTWGSTSGPFPRIMEWLATGLAALGNDVEIVYLSDAPHSTAAVTVRRVGLGTRASRSIPALIRYFRASDPDLILVSPGHISPFVLLAARVTGHRVVPWEQTFAMLDMRSLPTRLQVLLPRLRRLTYRWAYELAAVSNDVGTAVGRELGGATRICLLPNPCDADEVRALAGAPEPPTRYTILASGRLTEQKGFDVLIEAIALADPDLNSWEALILGDGPLRYNLRNLAHRRGVEARVRLLGYVSNPFPLVARAHVFVHPARWEGFGMVVVEALALGVPVVATSCPGGPREILEEGGCGLLVPPDDPEAICDAILRLAHDPESRQTLRSQGLRRAEDFEPIEIARKLVDLANPMSPVQAP